MQRGPIIEETALSRGERVSDDGAFSSRRRTGEGLVVPCECTGPWKGNTLERRIWEKIEVGGPVNVTIIGSNHRVQWEDPTGDLQNLIEHLVEDRRFELIAEEAYKLPTTVGFRVACRANKPWIEIEMSDSERLQAGICDELGSRSSPGWKDDRSMVTVVNYLPHADGIREAHWLKTILNHHVNSALVICGLLHMGPFAEKLKQRGCTVNESTNVCDLDWCKKRFGPCEVMEVNGRRCCEIPAK